MGATTTLRSQLCGYEAVSHCHCHHTHRKAAWSPGVTEGRGHQCTPGSSLMSSHRHRDTTACPLLPQLHGSMRSEATSPPAAVFCPAGTAARSIPRLPCGTTRPLLHFSRGRRPADTERRPCLPVVRRVGWYTANSLQELTRRGR